MKYVVDSTASFGMGVSPVEARFPVAIIALLGLLGIGYLFVKKK